MERVKSPRNKASCLADSVAAVRGIVALIDIIIMMLHLQPGQAALGNSWGFGRVRGGRPNSSCGTENNDIPELEILTAHTFKQDSQPGGQASRLLSCPLSLPLPGFPSQACLLFWLLPRGILITMGQGGVSKG